MVRGRDHQTQIWFSGFRGEDLNVIFYQNMPRLPTKMAAKLKIEKRGDEILIVHCCFSVSQNELRLKKFLFLVTAAILNGGRAVGHNFEMGLSKDYPSFFSANLFRLGIV
jgi:hypothetical protein